MEKWKMAFNVLPPRMVALVSTVDKKGNQNVAPHSEIIKLYSDHFLVSIDKEHDTYKNILETKNFVVGIPALRLANKIAITAKQFPRGVSEFKEAGLTPLKAKKIQSPLIEECFVNFECELYKNFGIIETHGIIVGKIVFASFDKTTENKLFKAKIKSEAAFDKAKVEARMTIGAPPL